MSLAFVWWIHQWPVNSPHKWPVTQKMFLFDDFIMMNLNLQHVFRDYMLKITTSPGGQWVNTFRCERVLIYCLKQVMHVFWQVFWFIFKIIICNHLWRLSTKCCWKTDNDSFPSENLAVLFMSLRLCVSWKVFSHLWRMIHQTVQSFEIDILLGLLHDDIIRWKHFPRYWPFVRGIHRSPVNSPHKGQWRGALIFSLIYAWINSE